MKHIWNTIKPYLSELSFVAVAVFIYFTVIWLIRLFDPTAVAFDAGTLQHLFYGVIGYFIFKFFIHVDIGSTDKSLFKYLNSELIHKDIMECTPFQRRSLYTWRLVGALLCMAILAAL